MNGWILSSILTPIAAGIVFLIIGAREKEKDHRDERPTHAAAAVVLSVCVVQSMLVTWCGGGELTLFYLVKRMPIYFHIDQLGRYFMTVISVIWLPVLFYAFVYMKHEKREKQFYGWYLIVYGVLEGICMSGNLITLYLFYELMTLTSMPMVLHQRTKESIMAACKYLFYSMCGAYMSLFGIFVLNRYCINLSFEAGGMLKISSAAAHAPLILLVVFLMIIGFGAKAGMFPLHAWLTSAHPVAPSPASAVLSSVIVKCGVLAIIRTVFYVVGADFIQGTWVQTAWMSFSLLTVLMGSMLAYHEKVFKRRLAYSTISQVSYILFGLSVMTETAVTGALLHVLFHAVIKAGLFMTAGLLIFSTGRSQADDFQGIGRTLPGTLFAYTICSLGLIGIPMFSGFISKWYLAEGTLQASIGVFRYLGPVVLLISALLTAGYLLPVTMRGYFPGEGVEIVKSQEIPSAKRMAVPIALMAVLTVIFGLFPNGLISMLSQIAAQMLEGGIL